MVYGVEAQDSEGNSASASESNACRAPTATELAQRTYARPTTPGQTPSGHAPRGQSPRGDGRQPLSRPGGGRISRRIMPHRVPRQQRLRSRQSTNDELV
ncbi:hypothetical protein BO71DRAFT_240167 [Aspergillus ellipticus CBS 707.79]|uniref:Uncharacterized protein n=1 Tax=Aspergillus ellipticus CBS 707.79 TaxID=1448320 RepID=A0A319D9L2_9EURO|nr:hypothetical protein BO71DRAFT_240167 [Aspergillus ellipticus CBS 707.79]